MMTDESSPVEAGDQSTLLESAVGRAVTADGRAVTTVGMTGWGMTGGGGGCWYGAVVPLLKLLKASIVEAGT